jgi:hypothetical protein
MNKLNRDIVNIINNYIKPLYYLKELEGSIKNIKYHKVFYLDRYGDYMENVIIKGYNKWERNNIIRYDYRLYYLCCKPH